MVLMAGSGVGSDELRGLLAAGRTITSDLELPVERSQQHVARGDRGHQREYDPALRLLACVHLRLRCLGQPPHASEQIDLPGGREGRFV